MTTATRDVLDLRRRLSARLKPLAFATGVLIALGLPLTYLALEYDATPPARLLAITLGLLVMSAVTGVVLAVLVYTVPVRLVGGMERHVAALVSAQDSLIAAGRVLTGSLDLSDVLEHLSNAARSLPGIDIVRIWLSDPQTGVQTLAFQTGHERLDLAATRTLGPFEGITGAVVEARGPIVVEDALAHPRLVNSGWFEAERVASCLGVPLLIGDTVLGTLFCMSRTRRTWSPDEVTLAETLGSLAAVAIRNATDFSGMTRRGQRLRAAADLARAVSSELEATAVLREIVAAVTALRGPIFCIVRLVDPAAGGYRLASTGGTSEAAVAPVLRFGEGLTHVVAESRRPLLVLDAGADPRTVGLPPHLVRDFPVYFGVPIQSGDALLGVLSVSFPVGAPPTADEREAIELYADQAAVAMKNAQLYAEATRREREAEQLARIARVLNETLDVADVGERIAEGVRPLFEARSSGLYSLEEDGSLHGVAFGGDARGRSTRGQRFPARDGVIGWIVEHNAPVASGDALNDPRFVFPESRRAELAAGGNTAVLAAPLRAKGTTIGVLAVADKPGRRFSDEEVALLQAFADHAALAFENARLYERAQRAYAELTETQDRLVRGETLRAMGELASGAAHHLNNLLAVILGRVQLALGKDPSSDIARHLTMAERATLDGADVVRRMRGFGQAQPDRDFVLVDISRIAAEVLELTRARWGDEANMRGISIETHLEAGDVPSVHGQTGPLREVLVNLVLNATDAMPDGGRLTIRTWCAGGWVHCAVTDTGVGMPPEVQRRALEPFFTTKGVKSTGLGLSVNYGIMQRLGGELALDSEEGRGSTVTFKLPLSNPRTTAPPPAVVTSDGALRILVIDDEPEVRTMLAELLTDQGHEVVEAASGAEGLQYIDTQRPLDVVLSDLGMPGMNGWEVAREVKGRRTNLPVVLVTGWGENPERSAAERSLADLVLEKPVTSASLRAALARVAGARVAGQSQPRHQ